MDGSGAVTPDEPDIPPVLVAVRVRPLHASESRAGHRACVRVSGRQVIVSDLEAAATEVGLEGGTAGLQAREARLFEKAFSFDRAFPPLPDVNASQVCSRRQFCPPLGI